MDIVLKRRLISVFGQWRLPVELINEKAKLGHAESAEILPVVEEPEELRSVRQGWNRRKDGVLYALRENFGMHFAMLVWPGVIDITVVDAHILVLALEHCYNAVKRLRPGLVDDLEREGAAAVDEYVTLWGKVREVRNALEHEEEYIAGEGLKPNLVSPEWTGGALIGRSRHMSTNAEGLQAVEVLGKIYHLGNVIDSCLHRVAPTLSAIMGPLCRAPNT